MQVKISGDRLGNFFLASDIIVLRVHSLAPIAHLYRKKVGGRACRVSVLRARPYMQGRAERKRKRKKKKRLTFAIGKVTATAPDCAHAAAWITPDTKVRLTLIPSSRCNLAAASIPDSVAGICFCFFYFIPMRGGAKKSQKTPGPPEVRHVYGLTATISMSLLRPSFSKRAMRLRALLQRASGSPSLRASTTVQWGPSTKFISAFPSSAN